MAQCIDSAACVLLELPYERSHLLWWYLAILCLIYLAPVGAEVPGNAATIPPASSRSFQSVSPSASLQGVQAIQLCESHSVPSSIRLRSSAEQSGKTCPSNITSVSPMLPEGPSSQQVFRSKTPLDK